MPGPSHRTARGNRLGLALVGLALTAAGAAALARGLAVRPALLGAADTPALAEHTRRYPAGHWWFWPAIAAATAVIALLALRWLALQTRTDTIHHLKLEADTRHGTTRLPACAATTALQDDLTASPYIQRANATLTGTPITPRLALTLTTDTDPATATQRTHQAITRLRRALEIDQLRATITIRTTSTRR
ncbi:MAG: hypothetical protein JWN52_914 [Actinomycetia bacterium]|nr:hypothetical protein [Actinomycetes bacterium]